MTFCLSSYFSNFFLWTCVTAAEYTIVLGSLLIGVLRHEPCAICYSCSEDFCFISWFLAKVQRWGDVRVCKREGLILSPMQGQAIYHSVSDSWKSWRKSFNFSSILHLFLGSLFSAPYSISPRMKHDWGLPEKLPFSILWKSGVSWSWRKEIIRNSPKRWLSGWVW